MKELHVAIDSTRSVQDQNAIETDITPLHYAVLLGRPDLVQRCLDAGSYVDDVTPKHGMTPSLLACFSGQGACLTALVERGADLTLEDNSGHTHADFCAVHCHSRCMRVLQSFDPLARADRTPCPSPTKDMRPGNADCGVFGDFDQSL